MKEFFNTNGNAVIKLYVNQIAMSVFGLMVISAAHKSDLFVLLSSVVAVGLYLFIIYSMMWDQGARAAAKKLKAEDVDIKKIRTPFLIILFGSLLNILGFAIYGGFQIYVRAGGLTEGNAVTTGSVLGIIMQLLNAMYMGFESFMFPNPYLKTGVETALILYVPAYYFLLITLPLFVTGIFAYYMGASEISILKKLGFNIKNKKVSDTHIDYSKNKK